jgi:hypothetical protein
MDFTKFLSDFILATFTTALVLAPDAGHTLCASRAEEGRASGRIALAEKAAAFRMCAGTTQDFREPSLEPQIWKISIQFLRNCVSP